MSMERIRRLRDGEELVFSEETAPESFRVDDQDPRAETVARRVRALSLRVADPVPGRAQETEARRPEASS